MSFLDKMLKSWAVDLLGVDRDISGSSSLLSILAAVGVIVLFSSWDGCTLASSQWPRGRVACGVVEAPPGSAHPANLPFAELRFEVQGTGEDANLEEIHRASAPLSLRLDPPIPAAPQLQYVDIQGFTDNFQIEAAGVNPCSGLNTGESCELRVSLNDQLCLTRGDLQPFAQPGDRATRASVHDAHRLLHGRAAAAPWTFDVWTQLLRGLFCCLLPLLLCGALLRVALGLPSAAPYARFFDRAPLSGYGSPPGERTGTLALAELIARLERSGWDAALQGAGDPALRDRPLRWLAFRALDAALLLLAFGLLLPTLDLLLTPTLADAPATRMTWMLLLGATFALWLLGAAQTLDTLRLQLSLLRLTPAQYAALLLRALLTAAPQLAAQPVEWSVQRRRFFMKNSLDSAHLSLMLAPGHTLQLRWDEPERSTLPRITGTSLDGAALPTSLEPPPNLEGDPEQLYKHLLTQLQRWRLPQPSTALLNQPAALTLSPDPGNVQPAIPPDLPPITPLRPAMSALHDADRRAARPAYTQLLGLGLLSLLCGLTAVALLHGAPLDGLDLLAPLHIPWPLVLGLWLAALAATLLLRFTPAPRLASPQLPIEPEELLLQGGVLSLEGRAVDLSRPFILHLTRSPDHGAASALTVELHARDARAEDPRLRLCAPLLLDDATPHLPQLDAQGVQLTAAALAALWPHLRAAAAIHGDPPPWTPLKTLLRQRPQASPSLRLDKAPPRRRTPRRQHRALTQRVADQQPLLRAGQPLARGAARKLRLAYIALCQLEALKFLHQTPRLRRAG